MVSSTNMKLHISVALIVILASSAVLAEMDDEFEDDSSQNSVTDGLEDSPAEEANKEAIEPPKPIERV